MTTKIKNFTANLEEVLLDFDGPQILLLHSGTRQIMAVAVKSYCDYKLPFFACAVKEVSYKKYMDGKADLRYIFDTAFRSRYFFLDFTKIENIKLKQAQQQELDNEKYWPKMGFFSRSHSSNYGIETSVKAVKKFDIDGSWDVHEFARFNNKLADLYAICDFINNKDDDFTSSLLTENISNQNFESGGSYGALYKNIKESASSLRLKEVQYASPGHISMTGNKSALAEISDLIEKFDDDFDEIEQNNKFLESLLKKEKLLSAPPDTRFQSKLSERQAVKYAEELYSSMGLDDIDWIKARCSQNSLVFVKFVRSIFKRAFSLWTYRREGRLQEIEFVS